MPNNKGFTISGVGDIKKILDEIAPRHSRNLLRATTHGVASEIAKVAKKNAPKGETGKLKKAIKAKRKKSHPDKPISEVIVEHGNNASHDAFYWRFVEYGTRTNRKIPFIAPAKKQILSNLNSILVHQFGKRLEAALKREAKKNSGRK